MSPGPVVPADKARPLADLVEALHRHVRLLRRYAEQAFEDHDDDYLGEVVAKLRVLVVEKGQNVALLIRLMTECGIDAPITLAIDADAPPPPRDWAEKYSDGMDVSLVEFLTLPSLTVITSTDERLLSKREFIEVVAEKCGAAHEDWKHPEYLTLIRDSELRVKGYGPLASALKAITTAVLSVADHVLPELTPEAIEAAERRRRG